MQNRYVGDIGDFGKYGLLRTLTTQSRDPALRLGVVWYMYPDETRGGDGRLIGYLCKSPRNDSRFRTCDPPLYDSLHCIVKTYNRNVATIRNSGILPSTTTFYEQPLSYPRYMRRPEREGKRSGWLHNALSSTSDSDLVFIDPDNGISLTAKRWRKKGPKYVYMDDLLRFYNRGHSLIIYHHLSRQGTAEDQIHRLSEALQQSLILPRSPWALRYRRGTARVYFIVPQERHINTLDSRITHFLGTPWKTHFQSVE